MGGMTSLAASVCLAVVASSLTSMAVAQDFAAVGAEFQVNAYTQSGEFYPAVGMAGSGAFVVVWEGDNHDGAGYGVFGQRFDVAGVRIGAEFQVSAYTVDAEITPRIAVNSGGSFVVVWISADGGSNDVFARRFDSAGVAQGPPFEVDQQSGTQYNGLTVDGDGAFVVAWEASESDGQGSGILARRFNSSGTAQGSAFQVNTYTLGNQGYPAVATRADGGFVVAWRSSQQDGDGYGVFARRFDSSGTGQGVEFQVNSYTVNNQRAPSVAMTTGGRFVVTWDSFGQDGNYNGIFAKSFDSSGLQQNAEFRVNGRTEQDQERSEVAIDADGAFVVTWESVDADGSSIGVIGRRFDASGVGLGFEFQVNSYTLSSQMDPTVAMNADGDAVVAWTSFGQDGAEGGIFAQRYRSLAAFDVDGNGSSDPLTDGLLVLRFLFGFRGQTLITGAVDLVHCTRCDAAAIKAYLEPRV